VGKSVKTYSDVESKLEKRWRLLDDLACLDAEIATLLA